MPASAVRRSAKPATPVTSTASASPKGGASLHSSATAEPLDPLPTASSAVRVPVECQTDATYPPGMLGKDWRAADALSAYHCKQYKQLIDFREHTRGVMTELGVSVHDLLAIKDVFLKMSDHLPHAPLTDLLLIASKVYRRTGELTRCLSAMYSQVFADDFVDDDFKFTEARIMKRTIRKLEKQLADVTAERDELAIKHEALSNAVKTHRNVVDGLQDDNDRLGGRNAALEDNMAVLFQQLAGDFSAYAEHQMADVQEELTLQEALSSARAQFASSIDAVQNRLRFFQSGLNDLQNDAIAFDPSGALKTKIKSLDVHAAHLANRFDAVRDGLTNTADELVAVLREKRRAVNLSLQHLKAYEVQNQRIRQSRQQMHELRQQILEIERVFQSTFSLGSMVRVDRTGDIHVSAAAAGESEGTTAAKRGRYTAGNTRVLSDMLSSLVQLGQTVTTSLNMDEEHKAVLRAVAMAVPASRKDTSEDPAKAPSRSGDGGSLAMGAAGEQSGADGPSLLALRRTTTTTQIVRQGGDAAANQQQQQNTSGGSGAPGGDMSTYLKLREDFSVKAGFLREVYEERIQDLESRVSQLQKKLLAAKREAEEDRAALQRALEGLQAKGNAETGRVALDDKSAAIRTKEAWLRHKAQSHTERAEAAHDALQALGEFDIRSSDKAFISPMAAFARISQAGTAGGPARVMGGTGPRGGPGQSGGGATGGRSGGGAGAGGRGASGSPSALRNASNPNHPTAHSGANPDAPTVYHTTSLPGLAGHSGGAMRTSSARDSHQLNVDVIRRLRDLERTAKDLESVDGDGGASEASPEAAAATAKPLASPKRSPPR